MTSVNHSDDPETENQPENHQHSYKSDGSPDGSILHFRSPQKVAFH